MSTTTVVTGVIGSDCHVVGTTLLRYAFEKAGFKVVGLGACVSQEEFINAAVETNAGAILVSSIYGHAPIDCEGLRQKCQEAGLGKILLYVGGLLSTSEEDWKDTESKFKALGFDRVYPPSTLPAVAIADIRNDLALN